MTQLLDLPTVLLGLLLIVGSVVLALGALAVVRPYVHRNVREYHNDVAGFLFAVVGVVYGVLAAFVVFAVWQQLTTVQTAASNESATLVAMYQEAQPLPSPVRDAIQGALRDYTTAVINREWRDMAHGRSSVPARLRFARIYTVYGRVDPRTPRERALYGQSLTLLDQLAVERAIRIRAGRSSLPGAFWFVLIMGAILTIGFSLLFYMEHGIVQALMTAALTALIAAMLFLVFAMDHPFAGSAQVTTQDLRDALATFHRISGR